MTSSAHVDWNALLDEYETRIAACRDLATGDLDARAASYLRALASGEPVHTPVELLRFQPPEDAGPIPVALRERARAVLDSGAAVEALLGQRRDEVFDRLRSLASRGRAFPRVHDAPRPRLLDERG